MINWQSLIFNSFWILGAAILLAAVSYHYWAAGEEGRGLWQQLRRPDFLRFLWLACIFLGIGLAGTSRTWWETALWVGFTLVSGLMLVSLLVARQQE